MDVKEETAQHELTLLKAKAFDLMETIQRLQAEQQQKHTELQGLMSEIREKSNDNAE